MRKLIIVLRFASFLLCSFLTACDSAEERVARYYASGQALLAEGTPEKAALEFRNALQFEPNHAPSHFALGEILENQGELADAMARYQRTVLADPDHVEARIRLARFLVLGGDLDAAGAMIDEVLLRATDRDDAQVLKASIALHRGTPEIARAALDQAAALHSGTAEFVAAEAGYTLKTKGPSAALVHVTAGLDRHPDDVALNFLKLQLLEQIGDKVGLGAHLTAMIARFPGRIALREVRARWAAAAGDTATAQADFEALIEAKPDDENAIMALVQFVRQTDSDQTARAALAELAYAEGASPARALLLARFDIETGNADTARVALKELVNEAEAIGDVATATKARLMLARLLLAGGDAADSDRLIAAVRSADPGNVEAARMHIARLIETDRLDDALKEARAALESRPDDPGLLTLSGRAYDLVGNPDLASERLASAVRAGNYRPNLVMHYARFLNRTGRWSAAEIVLSETATRHPEAVAIWAELAFVRVRLEDWAGAEQAAAKLDPLDPDRARQIRAASMIARDRGEEGALLLAVLPKEARARAASAAVIVETHLREGRVEVARTFVDELLVEKLDDPAALSLDAVLHLIDRDWTAAETAFNQILATNPTYAGAHVGLIYLETLRGDFLAARARLDQGLAVAPDSLLLRTRLAQRHELDGDYDAAIAVYEDIYRQMPDSMTIANNLASLLSDHRAEDPVAVERAYRIAGRLRGASMPHFRDTYGWTRYLKGEPRFAAPEIRAAAEALPNNPWVLYHLGMVEAALDRPTEARAAFERALKASAEIDFLPRTVIERTLARLAKE